jgi:site-specific recombinase XerD
MLRGGADVRVLQALFGHESIDDTAKYLRLVKEDVHNTYEEALEGVL